MFEQHVCKLSRRRFVLSALLGLATSGIAGCGAIYDSSERKSGPARWLSNLVGERDAAQRFGNAYLQAFPAERDLDLLLRRIDAVLLAAHGEGLALDDLQLLIRRLDSSVRDEYRRGELVLVAGWLLSRSEARLYAAVTMS